MDSCLSHVCENTENSDITNFFKQRKDSILRVLRDEHKKACHFVEAFRILNQHGHIIEGSSDDGEPKGSSGVPMLEVLRGKEMVNILCICVRYFGGTKLGVGGLVRAYSQAILNACCKANEKNIIIEYKQLTTIIIQEKASRYNLIVYLAQQYHIEITHREFIQENMSLILLGEKEQLERLYSELTK
ncbi:hypothetical protein CQA53_05485 [Helicobacter didelphidarum]|uniref:Impact N-terminal domain-containing protein n=2 Tax=Helicobacter didelphidarum TaxID=2040648 RepID=A0A3D8IL50_9HELI|nr:hypothetical protein CQA53_05485 [Helicobacter didelphidarum]